MQIKIKSAKTQKHTPHSLSKRFQAAIDIQPSKFIGWKSGTDVMLNSGKHEASRFQVFILKNRKSNYK